MSLLTAKQVGPMLGLSESEVLSLAGSGKITFYRVLPGVLRFDPVDVEAYKKHTPPCLPPRVYREYERLRIRAEKAGAPPGLRLPPELQALADRRVRNLRAAPWADKAAIKALYAEARRLSAETGTPHHVDHVIPLQGDFVSGLHVETNLRILTARENIVKRNKVEAC